VLTTLLGADATTIGARKRAREEDKEEGEVDPEAGEEEVAVKMRSRLPLFLALLSHTDALRHARMPPDVPELRRNRPRLCPPC